MPTSARTAPCASADARGRLRTARAYLEVASLVIDEGGEHLNVAAGLAVLAGIAASDSLCCLRLHKRHRGENYKDAADLLRTATPDGNDLARILMRLLDLKDEAHYGVIIIAPRKARDAHKWAARLVQRAQEEAER